MQGWIQAEKENGKFSPKLKALKSANTAHSKYIYEFSHVALSESAHWVISERLEVDAANFTTQFEGKKVT